MTLCGKWRFAQRHILFGARLATRGQRGYAVPPQLEMEKRSPVKLMEGMRDKTTEALHRRREGDGRDLYSNMRG